MSGDDSLDPLFDARQNKTVKGLIALMPIVLPVSGAERIEGEDEAAMNARFDAIMRAGKLVKERLRKEAR